MTFAIVLGSSLIVALAGVTVLSLLRRRSVTVHIAVLLAVTVLAVLTGILVAAWAMFISTHDLQVLLLLLFTAAAVSLAVGLWAGRRLARASVWAAQARGYVHGWPPSADARPTTSKPCASPTRQARASPPLPCRDST